MKLTAENTPQLLATSPRSEGFSLSLRYATGGGGFRFSQIRTRVRFCVSVFLCLAVGVIFAGQDAAISAAAPAPTITFESVLTKALVGLVAAATTWLAVHSREEKKAEQKIKIEQERQPPLGEDTARTYATKKELGIVEGKLSGDIKDLRSQINNNDMALRTLIVENDKNAENRTIGTHARIDTLYRSQNKTNRSLGILIGQLSVIAKMAPRIDDDENTEG